MRQLKIQKSITNRSSEALDKYLVEIGRAPLISIDEEIELAQKIKKGGPEGERAKNKLVTANLRFVVSVAKQYQHQGLTLTDLIDDRASRIDQLLRLLGLWRLLSFDNDIRVQIEPTAPKLSRKSVNDVPVQSTPDLPALFRVFGERGHGDFVSEHPEEIFVRQFHQRSL